eukprot:gene5-6_t
MEEDSKGAIEIIAYINPSPSATSESIGKALDKFLGPRPWWFVKKEPFKWDHVNNSSLGNEIVLGRFGKEWDPILQQVSATQYP